MYNLIPFARYHVVLGQKSTTQIKFSHIPFGAAALVQTQKSVALTCLDASIASWYDCCFLIQLSEKVFFTDVR
jgi:hypothetical protein